jgi:hypothetical protein
LTQLMAVAEIQEAEPHKDNPKRTVGLPLDHPKFIPTNVIEAAPDVGLFALFGICDIIGESYVKNEPAVPVALETVMETRMLPPAPLATLQYTLV